MNHENNTRSRNPGILTLKTRFDFILHVLNNSVQTIFLKKCIFSQKSMKEIDLFHVMSSDVVISGPKVTIYAIKLTS